MKNKQLINLVLVTAIIGLVAAGLWWNKTRSSAALKIVPESSLAAASLIGTELPVRRTFTVRTPWTGTVEPQSSVELRALVAGRIETIQVRDQQRVEKGTPLMRLGGPRLEDARSRLNAGIASMETRVDLARQTLSRLQENLKARLATKDQVAAAREALLGLQNQRDDARLSLDTLDSERTISASIGGVFTNRHVGVGQDVLAGQTVGDIVDTGRLRIAASLFPPQGVVLQGKTATVRLEGEQTVQGVVSAVLPKDSGNGAWRVWIESPEIDSGLRPGQMVAGDVIAGVETDALAVPESAIVYDAQDHPFLFIRQGDTYQQHRIRTGLSQDGWIEVLSGLKEDQLVVVRGAYELFYRKFNEQFKVQD